MNKRFFVSHLWTAVLVVNCWTPRGGAADLQPLSTPDTAQVPAAGSDGDSWGPIITPDGRFVLFASTADNLMRASNNLHLPLVFPRLLNIYLRDLQSSTTALVSMDVGGTGGGNADCLLIDVSTNGRYVLFLSSATNLVSADTAKHNVINNCRYSQSGVWSG